MLGRHVANGLAIYLLESYFHIDCRVMYVCTMYECLSMSAIQPHIFTIMLVKYYSNRFSYYATSGEIGIVYLTI